MKPTILAALLAVAFAPAAFAQTLCRKGETDHFSCPTGGGRKILSVCSNIQEGSIDAGSWLQYRFGKPGKIELAFPKEKKGSLSRFEGHHFNPRGETMETSDLRFVSGRSAYSVELFRFYENGESPAQFGGSVDVILGKKRHISIQCDRVDGPRYFDGFSDLNRSLRAAAGNTDLLYRFYQNARD